MGISIAITHLGAPLLLAAHHTLNFHLTWSMQAILALLAGILVLVRPKNLNIIVAAYLIVLGILEIMQIT